MGETLKKTQKSLTLTHWPISLTDSLRAVVKSKKEKKVKCPPFFAIFLYLVLSANECDCFQDYQKYCIYSKLLIASKYVLPMKNNSEARMQVFFNNTKEEKEISA
jgi:hypothetical protein